MKFINFFKQLLFMLLFFQGAILFAQNISASGGLGQSTYAKHFVNKDSPNLTIGITPPSTVLVWSYTASLVGVNSFQPLSNTGNTDIGNNLQIQLNTNNTVTIVFNGSHPGVMDVPFSLQARIGTNLVSKSYNLVIREPLSMVFVVDRSGSMECEPNEPVGFTGWPDCIADTPDKWDMVTAAIDLFIAQPVLINPNSSLSLDRYSVVYFDGTSKASGIVNATTPFLPLADFVHPTNGITTDLMSQKAIGIAGGTSIGAGLKNAIQEKFNHNEPGTRQVLVLISDGQQNTGLMLDPTGENILDTPNIPTNTDTQVGSVDDIERYCLALDGGPSSTAHLSMLRDFVADGSTPNADRLLVVTTTGGSTDQFLPLITAVFDSHTPQIIQKATQTITESRVEQTFDVNADGSSLFFSISFAAIPANRFCYRLEKDGVVIDTSLFTIKTNGNSAVINLDFYEHPELNSGGQWKLTCDVCSFFNIQISASNLSPVDSTVQFYAVIDDHNIKAKYDLGNRQLQVGDKIETSVHFKIRNINYDSAIVTAQLIKPGADKGDLVAKAKIPYDVDSESELTNPFMVKYGYLKQNDPEYLAALAQQEDLIILTSQGDGLYTGIFPDIADVADAYTVVFTIHAQDSLLGEIVRYKRLTPVIRFGTLIPNFAEQEISTDPGQGNFTHVLTYTPTYEVNGQARLVGPGYEDSFTLNADEDVELTTIIDNGDGSYTLVIKSDDRNPEVDLYLVDEPFYIGKPIQDFGGATEEVIANTTSYTKHLSLHFGLTNPLDGLDVLYNGSFFAEVDFGILLLPRLDLEFIAGYYDFASEFNIFGASANLRYNMLQFGTATGTDLTIAAGIGAYKPKGSPTAFGANIRLGLQQQLTPTISASLETAYFLLPSPNYSWLTYGGALRYKF